jgi:sortase A
VRLGDELVLSSAGKQYSYRVFSVEVVNPEDVAALQPATHKQLTLVTCFPFGYIGRAPRRLLVKAAL